MFSIPQKTPVPDGFKQMGSDLTGDVKHAYGAAVAMTKGTQMF